MPPNIKPNCLRIKSKNIQLSLLITCPIKLFSFCRTAELREKIETVNGEIQQLDMDLEEHQGKKLISFLFETVYNYMVSAHAESDCTYIKH